MLDAKDYALLLSPMPLAAPSHTQQKSWRRPCICRQEIAKLEK